MLTTDAAAIRLGLYRMCSALAGTSIEQRVPQLLLHIAEIQVQVPGEVQRPVREVVRRSGRQRSG